ncbi:MAG: peptidoglycan DD-metalloendopeptidase family protein [Cycloclasticus sp.]
MSLNLYAKIILLVVLIPIATLTFASKEEENKKQLALLRERMQLVEKNIAQTQRAKTKEERGLRQIEKRLSETKKNLRSLNSNLVQTEKKIEQLEQQKKTIEQDISSQKGLLAEQIRSAYFMGKQQRVKLLLNQQQPERISRVMQYYDYFNRARLDHIKVLDNAFLQLKNVEGQLKSERLERLTFVAAKRAENESLIASKKQRKIMLAKLHKDIKSSGQELAVLKENEKRLTDLLNRISQAINDIPISDQQNKPFSSLKGKLPWPIKGQLRKKFGSAKQAGRYDGVLITAREGAAIRSISHGRVVYADWLRGYGLLIIVDHGSNYLSLYAHNEGLYKEVGDWVSAGETIATVGISGGQQKAGLYFSIRKNGKPVNPVHWCRAVRKGRVG